MKKSDFLFWLLNNYYLFKYYIFTGNIYNNDLIIRDNYLIRLELENNNLIIHFKSFDFEPFSFNYDDFSDNFGETCNVFDSYEQATLAGIEYVLDNLI